MKQDTREKPTFQHIRQKARTREGQPITRQDLATLTGLSLGEVYSVDVGGYSSKPTIHKVLQAFNKLTGQRLTIDDIRRAGPV